MRKPKLSMFSLVTVTALTLSASLPAATVFVTTLSGANEVPPTGSSATGVSVVTLSGNTLTVNETFSGLSSALSTAAHIHCCVPIGTNAGIAVPFTNFPTATSGVYNQAFDLTAASTYTPAFLAASGGTALLAETTLIAGLNAGQAYANIHDANFPGGEIRGQLQPVPEPTTIALMLVGLPLLLCAKYRSKSRSLQACD